MNRALQKITVTFVLISLIPVGFIIYEYSSLNENEKIITGIYHNQLDAILYSVNQYTDDVISSWASRIDIGLMKSSSADSSSNEGLQAALTGMSAVREVFLTDLGRSSRILDPPDSANLGISYEPILSKLDERITRLKTYQRGGFRKVESVDTLIYGRFIPVYFLLDEDIETARAALLMIDLDLFVQNVLGPKLQAVSREEFVISAFRRESNSLIYSTETNPSTGNAEAVSKDPSKEVTQKELWLLPGYYLSISLKDATLREVVSERVHTSLIIFAALFVLLLGGILFLYANIRREMLLSQSKSEFVSNVSHEIRTPLSLISMYAETLEMGRVPDEKRHEYYTIIISETSRLSAIVNRILNFAQVDASKRKYVFKNIDLNELCAKVVKSYEPHMKERGFRFEYIPADGELPVMADEESVNEALINLLDNAVKYSHDRKEVVVRTRRDGTYASVVVEDHGIGIPRIYQKSIFEQFYRVPTDNVHNIKGTGLGLALVKRIMLAHKGRVSVVSSPGKGSVFTLTFGELKLQN